MRRKKSEHPEVFGFRIIAGTVGSFAITDKVRNANSLAFVDGVPIFERFFLGDEFTIRGYNVRSISPIAPVDTFITSQNVVVAENAQGDPIAIPSLAECRRPGCVYRHYREATLQPCRDRSLRSAAIRRYSEISSTGFRSLATP